MNISQHKECSFFFYVEDAVLLQHNGFLVCFLPINIQKHSLAFPRKLKKKEGKKLPFNYLLINKKKSNKRKNSPNLPHSKIVNTFIHKHNSIVSTKKNTHKRVSRKNKSLIRSSTVDRHFA